MTTREDSIHHEIAWKVVWIAVTIDFELMLTRPAAFHQFLALSGTRSSTNLLTNVIARQHFGTRDLADELFRLDMALHLLKVTTQRHGFLDGVLTGSTLLVTLLPALVSNLTEDLRTALSTFVFLM